MEKQKALRHLVAVWNRKRQFSQININENVDQLTADFDGSEVLVSKMEMLLRQKEMEHRECQDDDDEIMNKLKKFGNIKRSSMQEDTIEFWAKNKNNMSDIYEISTILNAVPATQVTVERAFSSLPFILSALRNQLHAETLENILIVRLNKDTFYQVPSFVLT